jgi:ATP/ADP translocase
VQRSGGTGGKGAKSSVLCCLSLPCAVLMAVLMAVLIDALIAALFAALFAVLFVVLFAVQAAVMYRSWQQDAARKPRRAARARLMIMKEPLGWM